MTRFKTWLVNKFLPIYAQEIVKDEIEKLGKQIIELSGEIEKRDAYIRGVKDTLRTMRYTVKRHDNGVKE